MKSEINKFLSIGALSSRKMLMTQPLSILMNNKINSLVIFADRATQRNHVSKRIPLTPPPKKKGNFKSLIFLITFLRTTTI